MRRRRGRDDRGSTAVEFGLVVIPFLVLTIGMIQYGWYFYVSQTTGGAASNVVRRLQVGDCWTGSQAENLAKKQAPMIDGLTKSPNALSDATPVGTTQLAVTVTADASIIGLVPLPDGGQVTKVVYAQLEDKTEGSPCT